MESDNKGTFLPPFNRIIFPSSSEPFAIMAKPNNAN